MKQLYDWERRAIPMTKRALLTATTGVIPPNLDQVERVIDRFKGEIQQVPPIFLR